MTQPKYKIVFGFIFIAFSVLFLTGSLTAQKVRLRAQITPQCESGSSKIKFADIYADGNIAVLGSYQCRGAFIFDVSNPDNPVLAAHYNPTPSQQFLEAIVIGNRGYFGSGNGGGVHIVDLSNPSSPQLLGVVDEAHGNGFNSVHEIVVWDNFLIENFNSLTATKILKIINISNPANPVLVREINPTEPQWVHAMHVRGNRLFTSGWGNNQNRGRTEIYDISNITTQAPTLLGAIEDQTGITAGNGMHSSWSSEDGNYLYSARETSNQSGDIRVYNISNPAQPLLVKRIEMADLGLNAITPHNPVVMGNKLYVSWYQAGVQVFDISNPANPRRIGQYDTHLAEFDLTEKEKETLASADPWDLVCGSENLQNLVPTSYEGNWAVYPFLGEDKVLAGDMTNGLLVLDASKATAPAKNKVSDFDGDGKTDFSVFQPGTGNWSIESSSAGGSSTVNFGLGSDKIVSGDYDGDGKTDIAVFRPSNGTWYFLRSSSGFLGFQFGANGDIPVAADYDADGKTDIAVWRPTDGVWYIMRSALGFYALKWGAVGDKPVIGDYEGDGKADFAVFRPSSGIWYVLKSSSSQFYGVGFGLADDKPLSGDFDGDGLNDIAVFRPSNGFWYILNSSSGSFVAVQFGISEDKPIPADFDGDGKTDIAVFRPSANGWYRLNSSNAAFNARIFGAANDVPSPTSVQP